MALDTEKIIAWGREHAMDPEFTEELDALDAEGALDDDETSDLLFDDEGEPLFDLAEEE